MTFCTTNAFISHCLLLLLCDTFHKRCLLFYFVDDDDNTCFNMFIWISQTTRCLVPNQTKLALFRDVFREALFIVVFFGWRRQTNAFHDSAMNASGCVVRMLFCDNALFIVYFIDDDSKRVCCFIYFTTARWTRPDASFGCAPSAMSGGRRETGTNRTSAVNPEKITKKIEKLKWKLNQ